MRQLGRTLRAFVFVGGWALVLGMSSCGGGGGGGGGAAFPIAAVGTPPPPSDTPATPPSPPPAPPAEPVDPPPATSRVVSDSIASTKTGASYPLEIYLPASYDGSSTRYP